MQVGFALAGLRLLLLIASLADLLLLGTAFLTLPSLSRGCNQPGLGLAQLCYSLIERVPGGVNIGGGRIDRRRVGSFGAYRRVIVLLRNLIFLDQVFKSRQVFFRFHQV